MIVRQAGEPSPPGTHPASIRWTIKGSMLTDLLNSIRHSFMLRSVQHHTTTEFFADIGSGRLKQHGSIIFVPALANWANENPVSSQCLALP